MEITTHFAVFRSRILSVLGRATTVPELPQMCTWGPKRRPCQFAANLARVDFQGRRYCPFHAPISAPGKWTAPEIQHEMHGLGNGNHQDFSGVVFPGQRDFRYAFNHTGTMASDCTFEDGADLVIAGDTVMPRCSFLGSLSLAVQSATLDITNSTVVGDSKITITNSKSSDFSCCSFEGEASFHIDVHTTRVSIRRARFKKAPTVTSDVERRIAQDTSFYRSEFRRSAFGERAEPRYRNIRNLFHANRDREQEGRFYAYEKRALRKSLGWRPTVWLPRFFSALYWAFADYGQSFERALIAFVVTQIGFGFSYSWLSGRLCVPGRFDSVVAKFTMTQLVRPFEILSGRNPTDGPFAILNGRPDVAWTALTTLHTIVSLSILALFFLALRWRFRRD